ncbi:hypothetical protein Cylst_1180 [Cylindrospermum stagnale PCC 7417]|uniref:Uncharacterized protein n=1 Tax=Cylindrospermum stagnale PCC 7417 TaxID=56107 RepID=K9WVE2_9NOST|nr:DUF6464 family protein [Cylindrospermum stagnale]AFZ23482.1 hypothetical protein Cylst_1180 [Cylindrospermum stagnale PCC 7417]
MFKTLLVITIGLLPSLISLWVLRQTHMRERRRLQQVSINVSGRRLRQNIRSVEGDRYYLEGVGYLVGDISCKFNARSGYVRCAVNPSGPCHDCRHYEPRELASSEQPA